MTDNEMRQLEHLARACDAMDFAVAAFAVALYGLLFALAGLT